MSNLILHILRDLRILTDVILSQDYIHQYFETLHHGLDYLENRMKMDLDLLTWWFSRYLLVILSASSVACLDLHVEICRVFKLQQQDHHNFLSKFNVTFRLSKKEKEKHSMMKQS